MTTVDKLKKLKKPELVTKARVRCDSLRKHKLTISLQEMNLYFRSSDKKAQILELIIDNLTEVAASNEENGRKEGNEEVSKRPSQNQREGLHEADDQEEAGEAEDADENQDDGQISAHEPSLTPVPDALPDDNSKDKGSTRGEPRAKASATAKGDFSLVIVGSADGFSAKKGSRNRRHPSDGELKANKESSARPRRDLRSRSASVSITDPGTASKPPSKGTPQKRVNLRSSIHSESSRRRKSRRPSHKTHESLNEDDLAISTSTPHLPADKADHDEEAGSEPDAVRDASLEQLQDDDEVGSETEEVEVRENLENAEEIETDREDEGEGAARTGKAEPQAIEEPTPQKRAEISDEEEPPRSQDPYPNFRSQRFRISMPDEFPVPLSSPRTSTRKSVGSAISNKIDSATLKEIQKDLEVSKFNHETLKQALEDAGKDRTRVVRQFEEDLGELHRHIMELEGQLEMRNAEINEFKVMFREVNNKLVSMNDEIKSLKEMMESENSQPAQPPQLTQQFQPPGSPAPAVSANIPLLSRASVNQPTPRNKTIERVQHQTQKEELTNPSPAPRTLGKHPRPRESTDSDIVETIRDGMIKDHRDDDEEDAQPPPKKRFRAGPNSWGGALTFSGRRESNATISAPTFAMPIFGPQFNDAALRTQPEAAAKEAEAAAKEADEQSGGEQEIVTTSKDTTSAPDVPPTPPATKTRYGTERDYDNRFAD